MTIKMTLVTISAVLVMCLALLVLPVRSQIEKNNLYIGLLLDFSAEATDIKGDLALLQEEIHKVLGTDKSVHFLPEHRRFTAGRVDRAAADYRSLADDPAVDLIIAAGPASAAMLAAQGVLPKPTIAVGILDVELQQMPLVEPGVSGVRNFTYVLSNHPIQKDLAAFYRIHPFAHLAVIISEDLQGMLDFEGFFERLIAPYKAQVALFYWETEAPLPALSDAVDAVYLAVVFERSLEEVALLAEALAERKLPSFAMSQSYVDVGMMACIGDESGRDQVFRKLALIVEGVALGEELAAMPVRHNLDEQWVLNAATVRRIGFDLSFETLFSARFLKADEPATDQPLSLQEIIAEGLQSNLDLRIEKRNVDLAGQDRRRAQSSLLPTVEASATLLQVDPDIAERAMGQQPERTGTGKGTVQQVLFSEPILANIEIQRYLAEAARHRADLVALDMVLNLATAYFDILLAKTGVRIQDENLKVSRQNLKIARTRNAVGYAGVADVFRWESEVARATQASIEAFNNLYLAKVQLNRLLNRTDIGEEFEVEDARLSDGLFSRFDPARIGPLIDRVGDVEILTNFLVEEALKNMPSIKQLVANIKALERQQRMNRRRYYLPTVTLRGQADYTFWRDGKGVPPVSSAPLDATWNLALNFSYPLFQGHQRKVAIDQTAIQQQQLRLQEEDLRQKLSQAVQVRVTNLVSRRTNIHFAGVAAASAQKNFDLVQDAYQRGQLEIAQLIDAQRATLSARQAEAGAVYEYLVSYLQLENSIGGYTMFMTSEEQEAFVGRLRAFFSQRSSAP